MYWKLFDGKKEEWDKKILESNAHYRQSYNWGEYKALMSWKVLRLEKKSKIGKSSLVQITYKKYSFFCAAYIPGNICGEIDNLDLDFIKNIKKHTKSFFLYVRMDSNSKELLKEEKSFKKNGWNRPLHKEHSSMTIDRTINDLTNDFKLGTGKSWNKNLNKSKRIADKENIQFTTSNKPNGDDLVKISSIMSVSKKIYNPHSKKEFNNLSKMLKDNTFFTLAYSSNGEPLGYRGFIYFKNRAWDLGAATSARGRDSLVSYLISVNVLEKASSIGVKNYNFGAMDKINKSGVYYFKKGIGENEYIYSGEWEYSNLPFMRFFINITITIFMSDRMRRIVPFINDYKF